MSLRVISKVTTLPHMENGRSTLICCGEAAVRLKQSQGMSIELAGAKKIFTVSPSGSYVSGKSSRSSYWTGTSTLGR